MIFERHRVLVTCVGLILAACSAQSLEESSGESKETAAVAVAEAIARPTEFRPEPASKLSAVGRGLASVRAELRKVPTHEVDVAELVTPKRALPLAEDTQRGSIRPSLGN